MLESIQIDLQKAQDLKLDVYSFLARERPFVESGMLLEDSLNHPFTDIKIRYRTNGSQYGLMAEISLVSSLFWLPQNVLRSILPIPFQIRKTKKFRRDFSESYVYRAIGHFDQVDYKVQLSLDKFSSSKFIETQTPRKEDKAATLKISFGYEEGVNVFGDYHLDLSKLSAPKQILIPSGIELSDLLPPDYVEEVDDCFIPKLKGNSKGYFLDAKSRAVFNEEFLTYLLLLKRYMGEIRKETSKLQYQGLLEKKVEPLEGHKFEELFYVKNDGLIVVPPHPRNDQLAAIPHAGIIHSPKTLLQS